jgi:hypothetical protein
VPIHPHADALTPGALGFWVVQVKQGPPLGWVTARSAGDGPRYNCYAYCRDASARRLWLREFDSLDSAVAWMPQHEPEIRDLISRSEPEPDQGEGAPS